MAKVKKKIKEKMLVFQEKLISKSKQMIKQGYFGDMEAVMPQPFQEAMKATQEIKAAVNDKKQRLFSFNMLISFFGESPQDIAFKEKSIRSKMQSISCEVGAANYSQDIALHSVLPIGFNNIAIKRTIPTEAMALFTPFDRQKTIQPGGFFYSLHKTTKQPIVINNNKLSSPSGFVLGSSGAGKGMFIKPLISYILMNTDDDVILIDPENENARFVKAFGGQGIELSSRSRHKINPFDIPLNDEDFENGTASAAELKIDLLLSILSIMTGGVDQEITQSIVDDVLKIIYKKFQESKDPADLPTLQNFYEELKKLDGEVERYLQQALKIYVGEGSWNLFSHKTNIDANNRFICYNTSSLGEKLKPIASFIMFDTIWNRVAKNRNTSRKTWVFFDEAHLVFKNKDEISKLESFYRRIRKYNGRVNSITQNIQDLLRFQEAKAMLANSDFVVILNQKKEDADLIKEILKIPDAIMEAITSANKGEGIIFAQKSFFPFSNLFPKSNRHYELMTTNSDELAVILEKERLKREENVRLYGIEYPFSTELKAGELV